MKKKVYKQPQFSVIEIEQTDIIATSGTFGINPGEGYDEQPW